MATYHKIGVFDSGVGGLTVLRELVLSFPNKEFVYLGDTARVPYGIRSAETIRQYAKEDAQFLVDEGAELIVVACNTATAWALESLRQEFDVPFVGVVEPGVNAALKVTAGNVGIIATEGTIQSQVYEESLKALNPKVNCVSKATPLFVPLVEEGLFQEAILQPVFQNYFGDFSADIDTLILGCTHYPLLKSGLQDHLGSKVQLVDSAIAICDHLKGEHDFVADSATQSPKPRICVTDDSPRVETLISRILEGITFDFEKVSL